MRKPHRIDYDYSSFNASLSQRGMWLTNLPKEMQEQLRGIQAHQVVEAAALAAKLAAEFLIDYDYISIHVVGQSSEFAIYRVSKDEALNLLRADQPEIW